MAEVTSQNLVSGHDVFAERRGTRRILERIGWGVMGLMLLVGLGSVIARMVFMAQAQGVADPASVYNAFDIRYVQLPLASWLHLLPALVIALAGPAQFVRKVRTQWPGWHRFSGRCYIVAGYIGAISGFVIGGLHPFLGFDGPGFNQSMATITFAALIFWTLTCAYLAVRRKQFGLHREWMVRSWALMMAIATERILLGLFTLTTNLDIGVLFGTTFWMAGAINVAAAEVWINLTRTPGRGLAHRKDLDERAAAAGAP